ncbi:hypothetical protein [Streptomyces sp. SID3212]|uniref:hypothetical protein n=1 Tax=unclassified Streptomyces TaxID=2593676 RepID=UPI0013702493|nr:hypothetical protein [Streptomyces sp. SID3212]MYV53450.1 hypothetical protein [Streptomyces sp. SID3212]
MLGTLAVAAPASAAPDAHQPQQAGVSAAVPAQWVYNSWYLNRKDCDAAAELIKKTTGYLGQCKGPMNSAGRFDLYLWQ